MFTGLEKKLSFTNVLDEKRSLEVFYNLVGCLNKLRELRWVHKMITPFSIYIKKDLSLKIGDLMFRS